MTKPFIFTGKGYDSYPYIAQPSLIDAVNSELILERPLLLEGEPGCGKTSVAYAIANEMGLPLIRWDIRSSTRAQDGLYTYYPTVRSNKITKENQEENPENFIYGPIGRAFRATKRTIILIDEIDKAGLDFSDDLLPILRPPWDFFIFEANMLVEALEKPIFVITNNQSQYALSDAFVRKCIFYYIYFPDVHTLREIASVHFKQANLAEELIDLAVDLFALIRYRISRVAPDYYYRPSISEFLDWLKLLSLDPEDSINELHRIRKAEIKDTIPYPQALLKFGTYNFIDIILSDEPRDEIKTINKTMVRRNMLDAFDEDEFRTLLFDINHNYDLLKGEGLEGKMREFLLEMFRQGRMEELLDILSQERPHIDWWNL